MTRKSAEERPRGARVLVVDDEARFAQLVSSVLSEDGYEVEVLNDGRQALEHLTLSRFDLVLSDVRMPGVDGVQLVRELKRNDRTTKVILMTAYATADTAVAALRAGVTDYLIKPFEMGELRQKVHQILPREQRSARAPSAIQALSDNLVGRAPALTRTLELARLVAGTEATVLLLGETGTGKSMLARAIHLASPRASQQLIELHCAALSETLLESELFGHEKGAFTGAIQRKIGQLEAAHGGTVFLDEIGEVPLPVQVKLLRFLQSREFARVGGTEVHRVDTRIIAATHRDLEACVAAGTFREDLFYRLNVFPIEMPPLRERREDIPLIVASLLERAGASDDRVSPEAMALLVQWRWSGNVRELENVVQRGLIVSRGGRILPEHLPDAIRGGAAGPARDRAHGGAPADRLASLLGPGFVLDEHVRALIAEALRLTDGNKTRAAELLGITRRRLYSTMQSLQMVDGEGQED